MIVEETLEQMDERELAEMALAQMTSGADYASIEWPQVARRVKEARVRAGMSESEVATRLGMTTSEYWDIEFHDDEAFQVFALAELTQLADILATPLDVMLFGTKVGDSISSTSYAAIAERLAAVIASEKLTVDKLSNRVGWDLAPVLRDPDTLGQFNVVGLRDVCRAIGVDWVSALPRPK